MRLPHSVAPLPCLRALALATPLLLAPCSLAAISGSAALEAIRRASEPRPESRAGLSVDTATGAQMLERRLLPFDAGQPFSLGLYYNSLFSGSEGPLGRGWRHDCQVTISGDIEDRMTLSWGGQEQHTYRYTETVDGARRYVSDELDARRDLLVLGTNNLFTLTRADGTQYVIGQSLRTLEEVRNKVGHPRMVDLDFANGNRPRGVRASLTSSEIRFVYDRDGLIDFIHDDVDGSSAWRYVDFTYDAQRRLTRISQPVMFTGDEYRPTQSTVTAPAGSPAGITVERTITRTVPVGLLRITAGTISTGRSEDLVIKLISPRGTEATVYDRVPDPAVSRSLANLATLSSAFEGEDPSGTWKIVIISLSPTSTARITSFGFRFSHSSKPTTFTYDSAHRLTGATDGVGRLFATTYDSSGRVATQDDGRSDNQLMRFSYVERADNTLLTTVINRVGNTSSFVHDQRYRLLSWTDALDQAVSFAYDPAGNRTSRTSAAGHVTRFAYDAQHNLTSITDPTGEVTLFQYDSNRNLTLVHDARDTETRFAYDVRNNLTEVTDYLGRTTRRAYDSASKLQSVTLPDGGKIDLSYAGNNMINFVGHPVNSNRGTAVVYDAQGRVTRRTDSDGYATNFTYSPTGQLLTERAPDGRYKSFIFDARDRLISEIDLVGHTTQFQYDGNGNVVVIRNALGQESRHTYDGEDRMIKSVDPLGQTRSTAYDSAGQISASTDGLGRTTRYRHDADGNLTSIEDPDGVITQRYAYTARGELESEAGAYNHPSTYTYDEMGNLASATDAAGRRVTYNYDPLNRHVRLTDAASRIALQNFDADGLLDGITDPAGRRTEFDYDRANRLTEIIYGPRIISYSYNERDLVTTVHDGTQEYGFDYDNRGRRQRMRVYPNNSITPDRTLTYTYDAKGNLLGTADSTSSVSRQLDALERVTSYTDFSGRQLGYSYDDAGRLSRLTYPGGVAVNYTYDAADQLTEVSDWSGRRTRFSYSSTGRITRIDFPNGTYRVIDYDQAGRPVRRSDYDAADGVICGYRYEYAIDGRLESTVRTDTALRYVPASVSMTYDAANRVTTFNGSPLTSNLGGGLTRVPLAEGFATVSYDSSHRVRAIGGTTYFYDPEDRLRGWRVDGGATAFFLNPHGGLSQAIERTAPSGEITRYVHGIGLLYEETGSSIRVYHYDDRGSTVALSGPSGQVSQRFAYGPYGEEIGATAASNTTPFRFLGLFGVMTEPNGVCSMRSRFYSPILRRFISEDFYPGELAVPNSLNRFAYANGDPMSFEDPDGEFINILIGAVAGAVGGVAVQAVSDLIQGKKADWRDYVSAAAGGAVTGALLGSGFGAVGAGAAGGLTQSFLDQSLNGALAGERSFDFVDLGLSTALGAAGGKLGGRFSRGINGAVGSAFRKQVVRNGILYSSKKAALRAPVRDVVKRTAIAVLWQAAKGSAVGNAKGNFLRLTDGEGDSPGAARSGVPPAIGSRGRFDQIRAFMGQSQRSREGPFLHFSLYQSWLSAAQVPLPSSPNAQPTAF